MASNYLYKREFVKSQKEKGLCIQCSNPTLKGTRCEKCRNRRAEIRKENYNKWKQTGLCCQCGRTSIPNKNYCENHYLKKISLIRLGSNLYSKELAELLKKQNYKCALTGDEISFLMDIELDHVTPITRGGRNELSNVRWVTKEANRLKQNLTDKELKVLGLITALPYGENNKF